MPTKRLNPFRSFLTTSTYLILHEMEKAGYPRDKSARIEEVHYWGYLGVHVLFAADLIVKLFVFLFLRKR